MAIESIFGGHQTIWQFGNEDEFLFSLGIDPEIELESLGKASGAIAPSIYDTFSSSEYLLGTPVWIQAAKTTTTVFVYDDGGTVLTYSNTLGSEAGADNVPNSSGNGMVITNDFIYCANDTTIYRSGGLSTHGDVDFQEYWIADLGMSALSNPTYPATRNFYYPNHILFEHNDGWVYVLDYDGANGRLHAFITDYDGTNGRGEMDVLTLPSGYMPMGICSYGTDLAVVCSPEAEFAIGANAQSAKAIMALWDTVRGNKAYRFVEIGERIATAIANRNGELFVTAGNIDAGFKVLRYLGEETFEVVASIEEGSPPPQSAVAVNGNMVAMGGWGEYPGDHCGLFSYGYRDGRLNPKALHHIARARHQGDYPILTAAVFLQRSRNPVMGWRTDTKYGLDKYGGSSAYQSVWMSRIFNIGKPFTLERITIPLTKKLAAGEQIEVDVIVDNEEETYGDGQSGIRDISITNFSSNEQFIELSGLTIEGKSNFYLKLSFTGTSPIAITFPIQFDLTYLER